MLRLWHCLHHRSVLGLGVGRGGASHLGLDLAGADRLPCARGVGDELAARREPGWRDAYRAKARLKRRPESFVVGAAVAGGVPSASRRHRPFGLPCGARARWGPRKLASLKHARPLSTCHSAPRR
ncbi:hypothetical protein VARIO8X_50012 [Burkholderiales bacterium 8X]|nr:hypothetical protein VARIO8X_50012 [Burkholderiales bacterium 8X]